jgi:hypothetical protein
MSNAALKRESIEVKLHLPPQSFDPTSFAAGGTVQLGDRRHRWEVWGGQQLGRYVALDTETTLAEHPEVPRLAMISMSDGKQHYLVLQRNVIIAVSVFRSVFVWSSEPERGRLRLTVADIVLSTRSRRRTLRASQLFHRLDRSLVKV